ncbi:hypothetical protein QBC46DRAFT_381819 [Diplogelasinospora grovesii]|uniref:Secreted protein n=1 Tax=Diplogelasinospora grovesii TaxID=303347 RepID=A0AAN6S5Z2_9PEZI|nr:hypothetical protein QBC46DRAFT_381819 [Diplogelasinospora grovesii]
MVTAFLWSLPAAVYAGIDHQPSEWTGSLTSSSFSRGLVTEVGKLAICCELLLSPVSRPTLNSCKTKAFRQQSRSLSRTISLM